jgi:hypothetical protein
MKDSRAHMEFTKAYTAFARASEDSKDHSANRWSFDELLFASVEDPERAWEMIKAIVEVDSSPRVMEITAAGPLEELLVQHGERMIAKIENDAEQNDSIRELLGGVWQSEMPGPVWAKVLAIRTRKW